METLQLTKYQARQAINTWKFAQEDLSHKDLNYVKRYASIYDPKYSDIKEENGVFLWVRNSEGNSYILTIDIQDPEHVNGMKTGYLFEYGWFPESICRRCSWFRLK